MEKIVKFEENIHVLGDSTERSSYESALDVASAGLLLADPPYCLLTRRRKKGDLRDSKGRKIEHEAVTRFESVRDYRKFTSDWLEHAVDFVRHDGIVCIWTNFLGKEPIKSVALELGLNHFRGEFTWAKLTREKSGNEVMARIYEVALVFSKIPEPELTKDDLPVCRSVVCHYDQDQESGEWNNHPNHKPFSVLGPLIRTYSRVGDRILDPFSGSGSTPSAAIKLGRKISAIEIRNEWAEISRKRCFAF